MKAVILAAGEGRRMRPLTFTRPKCMIPIAGKPILEHVVEGVKAAGVRDVMIVVKYMGEKVRAHFGDGRDFGVKISYAEQGAKYGTAAAFASAKGFVDGEEFLGVAGDVVVDPGAIRKVVSAHSGKITMGLKAVDNPSKYGVVKLEKGRVTEFAEKPEKPESDLVNTSIYCFGEGAMDALEGAPKTVRGEYEITGVIQSLAEKGQASGVEIGEYWMDVGMPWQFLDASGHIIGGMKAENRGEVENSTIKGKVVVEKGAKIFNSYVEGPAYIGRNSVVGPFVYIRPATAVGGNCSLSSGTTVKNSILMDGVNAKHLTYIGDSIVGENCNFGAGTQVANYKFDASSVRMRVGEINYDTEKHKLGVVIGDNVKTGVLSCAMPGKTIGDGCWIGAGVVVNKDIGRNRKVFVKQELEELDGG
ncbi:MAG: sugar phosphate nucleotidyltransferase [Candidatus ainarchaeum sp.]|nr:sugar phosphate nucleotidyltransferase [Candidatus ainarchaeum sp.]